MLRQRYFYFTLPVKRLGLFSVETSGLCSGARSKDEDPVIFSGVFVTEELLLPIPKRNKIDITMRANATLADPGNMSDIQSLARRVEDLSSKVDWWNQAIIWSLVIAAIAAIIVGLFTYMAFRRAKSLAQKQADLSRAKETQLQADLSNKDIRIAEAGRDAAKANQRAEELRAHNLELEKAIAPRVMVQNEDTSKKLEALKPFIPRAGVIVECVPDAEPRRAAGSLVGALQGHGWKILQFSITVGSQFRPVFDGVEVDSYIAPRLDINAPDFSRMQQNSADELRSMESSYALIDFLQAYGWETTDGFAEPDPPLSDGIPVDTIRIRVGFKPGSFFGPPEFQKRQRKEIEEQNAMRRLRLEAYRNKLRNSH